MEINKFICNWCPPIILRNWDSHPQKAVRRKLASANRFSGDYATWADAQRDSVGYDAQNILERTLEATLKVKKGEAVFERDSVVLERPEYPFFVLTSLLYISQKNGGRLNVLDFGGALGTTYFQCRKFLANIPDLHWNVVEQKKHVEYGKRYIEDGTLRFYFTIEECLAAQSVDVVILSGVLSVIEKPYQLIEQVISQRIAHVIVDRQPLSRKERERLSVMTVSLEIYEASFPYWFLSEEKFRRAWGKDYGIEAESKAPALIVDNDVMSRKAFFFSLKGL